MILSEENKDKIASIIDSLSPNISTITITYSGSGGDRDIDPPYCQDATGKSVSVGKEIENLLDNNLINIIEECLDNHHDGWYDEDGSSGDYTIDRQTGKIENHHNEYYTESRYSKDETSFLPLEEKE